MSTRNSLILHVPHSSLFIPRHVRALMLLSEEKIEAELLAMTDRYTDGLFYLSGVKIVISPISRLVVDMERFRDDNYEVMAAVGMGAVYRRTSDGKGLRHLDLDIREEYLRQYYDPYHAHFEQMVESSLAENGQCLIIDCHSFPAKSLPYEGEQYRPRPEICLGTCDFHTPQHLRDYLENRFSEIFSVDINHPFAGSFVPSKYYLLDKRVTSIMIELNRSLYMNEADGQKLASYGKLKVILANILEDMINLNQ